jgi:hypothetical protein
MILFHRRRHHYSAMHCLPVKVQDRGLFPNNQ